MNLFKSILGLAIFGICFVSIAQAQSFQGKATYQSKTKFDLDLSQSGLPADRIKMIEKSMKDRMEATYELIFDQTKSIYKKEEQLQQQSGGNMRFRMVGGNVGGKYFKNTKEQEYTKEIEFYGKNFLVKDKMKQYDWKTENETKQIGQYLCFKATTTIEMPARRTSLRFGRGARNKTSTERDDTKEKKADDLSKMETVVVTAWYTLDIPVNNGPGDYWGLPGLILEVSYAETNILCTKIVINPKEKINLVEPSKGKKVSQKEFDQIRKEKLEEAREMYRSNRGRNGDRIRIVR